MAFEHRLLMLEELGPAAAKVCGPEAPAAMRAMAARGLAPLGPRDLAVALYQLWVANEATLSEQAAKSMASLPANVLHGALEDRSLPPGVLDFLGRKLPADVPVLERIVRHPHVHDETLAALARVCPEPVADLLAQNEQRWLRCPAIVQNLYENPNARMSVVHRMLELAVRQGLELNLPNIEEIKLALRDDVAPDPGRDELFRSATGADLERAQAQMVDRMQSANAADTIDFAAEDADSLPDLDLNDLLAQAPTDELSLPLEDIDVPDASSDGEQTTSRRRQLGQISSLSPMEKIRLCLLGSGFERALLIRDANKQVALSAIKSPRVKENEVIAFSSDRTLSHEVIRYIARRRDWVKLYAVKLNLVLNPKTPMSQAMSFLGHLYAHDVRKVAHSRSIPSALAQAAKRKMNQGR